MNDSHAPNGRAISTWVSCTLSRIKQERAGRVNDHTSFSIYSSRISRVPSTTSSPPRGDCIRVRTGGVNKSVPPPSLVFCQIVVLELASTFCMPSQASDRQGKTCQICQRPHVALTVSLRGGTDCPRRAGVIDNNGARAHRMPPPLSPSEGSPTLSTLFSSSNPSGEVDIHQRPIARKYRNE